MKRLPGGLNPAEATTALGSLLAAVLSVHAAINARLLRRTSTTTPVAVSETVSICIPARNEARNISGCLGAVLASEHLPSFEVFVFDDDSVDATASIVESFVATDGRVHLLRGRGSPASDWIGKPHASEQLRVASSGAVLVFVDADVRLEPFAVAAGIGLLRRHNLAMVCPYPRQLAVTAGERLVQPLLQWLWMTFLPLRFAERPRPASMVAANGQFMVIDAEALRGVGGFAGVRDQVLDDIALGRVLKRAGHRVTVADGTTLASCRMYRDRRSLVDGYAKSLWSATGSPRGAVALSSFLGLTYVVPPLAGLFGACLRRRRLALIGALGYVAGVLGRVISARRTGGRVVDSAFHPLSIASLVGLLVVSWRRKHHGTIRWKGRSVEAAHHEPGRSLSSEIQR